MEGQSSPIHVSPELPRHQSHPYGRSKPTIYIYTLGSVDPVYFKMRVLSRLSHIDIPSPLNGIPMGNEACYDYIHLVDIRRQMTNQQIKIHLTN